MVHVCVHLYMYMIVSCSNVMLVYSEASNDLRPSHPPKGRLPHFQSICSTGKQLQAEVQVASKAIGHRVSTLQERWKKLTDMMANRKTRLEEAAQSQQVSAVMCVVYVCMCVCGGVHVCGGLCM